MFHYRQIPHLDAAENSFFQRQLEQIAAESYDVKYAQLKGRQFLPTKSIEAGAESYTYRQYDWRAKAAPMIDMADDLPMANTLGVEFTFPLRSFGLAFSYSLDEIQAGVKGGRPLERERAEACRLGLAQYLDDVCATGDATFGLKGLLNLSNTETYTTPVGTAGGKNWFGASGKTPDEIIKDLNAMKRQIVVNSKDIERPTKFILPTSLDEYISNTPRSSTSDTTIKEFWLGTNKGISTETWERLETAGTSNSTRIVAYDPKAINLHLLMSIEYEQLAPQQRNFVFVVNARLKTGGVVSPYPKTVIYGDEM
jgi:hypothetical protein